MRRILATFKPDVVHVHNVFPLISPSVLPECRQAGVPIVMTVHNYRLVCPSGLLTRNGTVCTRCVGGREWRGVVHNCQGYYVKSLGYALRSFVARWLRFYQDNVTLYIALTRFQQQFLVDAGFLAERMVVVPNPAGMTGSSSAPHVGDYVGYVGRISPEKGLPLLLGAARSLTDIPVKIAGSYDRMPGLLCQRPKNVEFIGHLAGDSLYEFYRNCRFVVLPTLFYETFGMCVVEAAMFQKPSLCSKIAGLSEVVRDGVTGLLFRPGDMVDLTEKAQRLWNRPELCLLLGQAARRKALEECSPDRHYERLMSVYERAVRLGPPCARKKSLPLVDSLGVSSS